MKGSEVGDSIHGHRIIAEARKVSDPVVIVKSGRHKAQRIVLIEIIADNNLALFDVLWDGDGLWHEMRLFFRRSLRHQTMWKRSVKLLRKLLMI